MNWKRTIHVDVTYRKAEDMQKLEQELKKKDQQIQRLQADIFRFSQYAARNIRLLDELRYAKDALDREGLDSSMITSVKSRIGKKSKRKGKEKNERKG